MEDLVKIIEGCKSNDRISQEKLYRQFYPGLYALCKKFFDYEHDILTALNNGMLNVFRNILLYNPAKGEVFNWVYTIVRNAAISHLLSQKQIHFFAEISKKTEDSFSYNPFKELEWNDIYLCLNKLPPATRAICTLYYLEGYSVREIATQLHLSEGTVKWHLSESRIKLKYLLTTRNSKSV